MDKLGQKLRPSLNPNGSSTKNTSEGSTRSRVLVESSDIFAVSFVSMKTQMKLRIEMVGSEIRRAATVVDRLANSDDKAINNDEIKTFEKK